jgi:hypothetical protein
LPVSRLGVGPRFALGGLGFSKRGRGLAPWVLLVLGILVLIAIFLIILDVGVIRFKHRAIVWWRIVLKEIGDFLFALKQDLHQVEGDILVPVVVEGGCKSFVADTSSAA